MSDAETLEQLYSLTHQVLVLGICSIVLLGLFVQTRQKIYLYGLCPLVLYLVVSAVELRTYLNTHPSTSKTSSPSSPAQLLPPSPSTARETSESKDLTAGEIATIVLIQFLLCGIYTFLLMYLNPVFAVMLFMIGLVNLLVIIFKWPTTAWNILSILLYAGFSLFVF